MPTLPIGDWIRDWKQKRLEDNWNRTFKKGKYMSRFVRTICVDFDGVLHSYASGWQGAHVVADEPVPGAIEWLREMIESPDVQPVIYSARSKEQEGVSAMGRWLLSNGLTSLELVEIEFPTQKPSAFLTIDDRAICFDGNFPTIAEIVAFKPWNKKEV